MLNFSIKKKGISPLIATTILLVIAVSLGAIVMNFTRKTTTELTAQTDQILDQGIRCSLDFSLRILDRSSEKLICYNRTGSNNLEFVLENQGSESAIGVRVIALDFLENIKTSSILSPLGTHNVTKYNLSLQKADDNSDFIFPPIKIMISPLISSANGIVVCSDNRIELESIEQCV